MIPADTDIQKVWEKYSFPAEKRVHVTYVDAVAQLFGRRIQAKLGTDVNLRLLHAASLLHDIDKNAEKLSGERHPDACVRILKNEDMPEVADVVRHHPLHAIIDPSIRPSTWEEKILYLSDKMVKYKVLTVDKRFDLWRAESLSGEGRRTVEICYPKVKDLEREILGLIGIKPEDVAKLV